MNEIINKLFIGDPNKAKFPIDRRMKVLSDNNLEGMSSENIKLVINECVKLFAKTYLEIGTYKGNTLISAKYNNSARCIAIDNFSEFNSNNNNIHELYYNLKRFNCGAEFYEGDYNKVIIDIFKNEPNLKIDVYLYDGPHDYNNQINGLNIIQPYLSDKAIMLIDDASWTNVNNANLDWLKNNPEWNTLLLSHFTVEDWTNGTEEYRKSVNNSTIGWPAKGDIPYWWNGFRLFWRNI